MSLETKFQLVKDYIEKYNETCTANKLLENLICSEKFIQNIILLGATDEDSLKSLSHEDLHGCVAYKNEVSYSKTNIKPSLLIKNIAKVLRGDETNPNKIISKYSIERMDNKTLLENFDPEINNLVYQKLKDISKNKKFIIYNKNNKINIEASLYLLNEITKGFEQRNDYSTDEGIRKTYSVDELPNNFVNENPIYQNRPLRPDESCDQTNRSWAGISLKIRQLISIIVKKYYNNKITLDQAHNLLDMCVDDNEENVFKNLSNRYRESALEFSNLESTNNLPSLKIQMQKNNNSSAQNFTGNRVTICK